jgi:hypothetical protein
MEHVNARIIRNKLGLLNLAQELGNVSKACKVMGLSRDTFYRYQAAVEAGGVEALVEKSRRKPNQKNRTDESTEAAVVAFALEFPAYGQVRASNELRKQGVFISPAGVRCVWLRHDLARFKQRLAALERKMAETGGMVLTEAQVVALERKREDDLACGEIETAHPGYLGSQDTFYVGTLKGVGRIYQQTFVDTYSKWAAAKLYTTKTPITAADLLNDRVLPFFEEQGMDMLRILTDRGTEFCGKPSSAITNSSWPSMTSSIPRPKRGTRRRMASVSASTGPSCRSSIRSHSARSSTVRLKSCSRTWTGGSSVTTPSAHMRARCVAGAHPSPLCLPERRSGTIK